MAWNRVSLSGQQLLFYKSTELSVSRKPIHAVLRCAAACTDISMEVRWYMYHSTFETVEGRTLYHSTACHELGYFPRTAATYTLSLDKRSFWSGFSQLARLSLRDPAVPASRIRSHQKTGCQSALGDPTLLPHPSTSKSRDLRGDEAHCRDTCCTEYCTCATGTSCDWRPLYALYRRYLDSQRLSGRIAYSAIPQVRLEPCNVSPASERDFRASAA